MGAGRVVLVRHGDDPPDDRVHSFLLTRGFEPVVAKPFKGERLDLRATDGICGSVVYGGRFEAYAHDRYPFLKDEARWIEHCLKSDVPLLGICLGAQQIADVLGAPVGPPASGVCEFGYYEVAPTEAGRRILPSPLTVCQSHFHTFGLPAGATLLAASALFPHQAFAYGKCAFALQFHPEQTIEGFRRWQSALSSMYGRPGAQSRQEQSDLMYRHDEAQAVWFYRFLDRLFGEPGGDIEVSGLPATATPARPDAALKTEASP